MSKLPRTMVAVLLVLSVPMAFAAPSEKAKGPAKQKAERSEIASADKARSHQREIEDEAEQERRAGEQRGADAADKGSEKAREMRARKEERRAIKEAYKSDVEAGGERVRGKKPWWKFWGSDDASE